MPNIINKLLNKFVYDRCSCGKQKLKTSFDCHDCYRETIRANIVASLPPAPERQPVGWSLQYPPEYYQSSYVTTYNGTDGISGYTAQQPVTSYTALYSSTADYWPTQPEIQHASTHSPDVVTPMVEESRRIRI